MLVAVLLAAGAVLQLALPGATALPDDPGLAPRRLRLPTPVPVPDYPAVLRAPIFSPTRTPGEAAAGGDTTAAASLQLLAVAISGRAMSVVVRTPDGTISTLRPGQSLQGWRLAGASADRAMFTGPAGRLVLSVGVAAPGTGKPASPSLHTSP